MTDSGRPNLADRIDRYVRGELSAAEARELAQASLDAPELFEELTDSALAKAALSSRTIPSGKIVRFPRKTWFAIAGVAAAAVVISLAVERPWRTGNSAGEAAASSHLKPALALFAAPGQPVLLASGLRPTQTGRDGAPVFRGPETDSRAPQPAGSIVSIEDGLAAINLGSVDGLANGSELQVFRNDQSSEAVGRLQVTAVFRERARGRILDGMQVRVKDRVRVNGATHVDALLEQVDTLYNRGDADAAYKMAGQASRWAETASVPPDRQSALWNKLAVLQMLRGDYQPAEAPLSHAASTSPKTDIAYARSLNNLGVLAELRGDRRKAEARYADAIQAFARVPDSPRQERRAVETNLARIRGLQ